MGKHLCPFSCESSDYLAMCMRYIAIYKCIEQRLSYSTLMSVICSWKFQSLIQRAISHIKVIKSINFILSFFHFWLICLPSEEKERRKWWLQKLFSFLYLKKINTTSVNKIYVTIIERCDMYKTVVREIAYM